jgi:putative thioredoxin
MKLRGFLPMPTRDYIIDATSQNFAREVIERSQKVPVAVDFWAGWCAPCQILMPILHGLADELQGQFVLAKVDSDREQRLARTYGVRSLPTVKLFRHGRIVEEFVGVQPESVIRKLVERHIERESDRLRERARTAMAKGDLDDALILLNQAHELDPDKLEVTLDLAQALMQRGDPGAAQDLLESLPLDQRASNAAKTMVAKVYFARASQGAPALEDLQQTVASVPGDLDARYQLAARMVTAGAYEQAMDELLEIMRRDRSFRDDIARRGLLSIFEVLGNTGDVVNEYRRKLARLLY